jgi:hypothetical protein
VPDWSRRVCGRDTPRSRIILSVSSISVDFGPFANFYDSRSLWIQPRLLKKNLEFIQICQH